MPDITALTAKVQNDKDGVTAAQTALDAANAQLKADQAELDSANFVNQIEALAADANLLSTIEAALAADGSKITISVAP